MKSPYVYLQEPQRFGYWEAERMDNNLNLHQYPELLYLIEGESRAFHAGTIYEFHAGDFILVFPNVLHSFASLTPIKRVLHVFRPDTFPRLAPVFEKQMIVGSPIRNISTLPPEAAVCMQQILQDPSLLQQNTRAECYLGIILSGLLDEYELKEKGADDKDGNVDLLYNVIYYINTHFNEKIELEDLSKRFAVSKFAISHLFKTKVGKSVPQYLNSARLDHAVTLLQQTTMPITEIAFRSGFKSLPSFFRVFKEAYPISPNEYREQWKDGSLKKELREQRLL